MRRHKTKSSNWMSFTDLMTGLMVVFMFIAISFILEVVSFRFVEDEITNTINNEFKEELEDWGAKLSDNLTVRFLNENNKVRQFNPSSSTLTREFEKVLDKKVKGMVVKNLPEDLDALTKDEGVEARNKDWVEGLEKDIYLNEVLSILRDMN